MPDLALTSGQARHMWNLDQGSDNPILQLCNTGEVRTIHTAGSVTL
jgi:hypothetical protein